MSQWVEGLLYKCEDLSLGSLALNTKSAVAPCAPVTSVLEGGLETAHWGLLAFHTAKRASSKVSEKPCLKRMRLRDKEDPTLSSGLCGDRYTYTPLFTQHMNACRRTMANSLKGLPPRTWKFEALKTDVMWWESLPLPPACFTQTITSRSAKAAWRA